MSWSTSELRVRLAPLNRFKPSSKIFYWPFQGGTSFVDLLYFVLSCVCYVFVRVCLYVLRGHLLGKGWPLGSRLWCLLWVCHFPIGILGQVWYLIVSIPDLCNLTYFQSKLVEHCSVALEGVFTSKETAFKLCSPAIVNIIVHWCPNMVCSSNTYTVGVYIPQRRLHLNVLPPLGFDRTVDSTVNQFFPSVFFFFFFFFFFFVETCSRSWDGDGKLYFFRSSLILLNHDSSDEHFIASCSTAISFSIPSVLIQRSNKLSISLCNTDITGSIPSRAREIEFWALSGIDCNCLRDFLWNCSNDFMSPAFKTSTSRP